MTELIYLDSTRPWALKVFETLILSGSALHRLDKAEDQESQGAGDGLQISRKFYEDLKEACLNWMGKSSMSAGIKWSHEGAYLNIINLFLCVACLCVSNDVDSDDNVEDTSGYDNKASGPLDEKLPSLLPDNMALPLKIRQAADVWSVCHWVYLESPVFQRQLSRLGGLNVCHHLMTVVLRNLTSKTKVKSKKKDDGWGKESSPNSESSALTPVQTSLEAMMDGKHKTQQLDPNNLVSPGHMKVKTKASSHKMEEDWPLQSIRLLEALLSICLHSSKSVLLTPESNISFQVGNIQLLQSNPFSRTTQ